MPDAPTATYVVKNENGNELLTVANVLAEVRQEGCATATSNLLTVADSTVLYPGMGVCCYQVPEGTYIVAIKDATTVVMSALASGTGEGIIGIFKGFNFVTISKSADRGYWRNNVSSTSAWDFKTSAAAHPNPQQINGPFALVPKTFEPFLGAPLTFDVFKDDACATNPTLRTKTEHWSFWTLVCTGGHISVVPFDPEHSLHLKSLP